MKIGFHTVIVESKSLQKPVVDDINQRLVDELARLKVPFLLGGRVRIPEETMQPAQLLVALATNPEARLRLAVIPLLLCRPEFAFHVDAAVNSSPPDGQVVLRCYYTAAHLLQKKYDFLQSPLPDFFSEQLEINLTAHSASMTGSENIEAKLSALATVQARLSGRSINWQGTYEHGVKCLQKNLYEKSSHRQNL